MIFFCCFFSHRLVRSLLCVSTVLALDGIPSFCETPDGLYGLENVRQHTAAVRRKWMQFKFWGNYPFKVSRFSRNANIVSRVNMYSRQQGCSKPVLCTFRCLLCPPLSPRSNCDACREDPQCCWAWRSASVLTLKLLENKSKKQVSWRLQIAARTLNPLTHEFSLNVIQTATVEWH